MSLRMFDVAANNTLPDHLPAVDTCITVQLKRDGKSPRTIEMLVISTKNNARRCLVEGVTMGFDHPNGPNKVLLVLQRPMYPGQESESFCVIAEDTSEGNDRLKALVTKFENIMREYDRQHTFVTNNEMHALRSAVNGPSHASTSFKPGTHGVHDEMDGGIHAILAQRGAEI